jgi:hypothetical protein
MVPSSTYADRLMTPAHAGLLAFAWSIALVNDQPAGA